MDFTVYAITFAILVSILTMRFVLREQNTVQQISGPPSPWLFGHMLQLMLPGQYGDYEFQWLKHFGSVYRVKSCFGQDRLVVADPLALQYILGSSAFGRVGMLYVILNLLYRERSVIGAQGAEHQRIRTALNAGFTATAVREYEPVFQKVAESISKKLESCARTKIYPLLISATLDATSQGQFSDIASGIHAKTS
ncbi:hypothetical protein B0H14DRAFT_3486098 [Mycena olivaceomarginata]|nr:hypothetical protein B0H14DRAFT_3486098 [Mycena olivaceomarginata]